MKIFDIQKNKFGDLDKTSFIDCLEDLIEKSDKFGCIYGETLETDILPLNFDISLKNTTHYLKNLRIENENEIHAEVGFLKNEKGKSSKIKFDKGDLEFRPRMAGTSNDNTKTIKKIFTFDLVEYESHNSR